MYGKSARSRSSSPPSSNVPRLVWVSSTSYPRFTVPEAVFSDGYEALDKLEMQAQKEETRKKKDQAVIQQRQQEQKEQHLETQDTIMVAPKEGLVPQSPE